MQNSYNYYYQEPDYYGSPYPQLQEFFKNYKPKGTVLDLGCGQGRDAIFLGQLGYQVIGIDKSIVGIEQLNQKAEKQNLGITGKVADVYNYHISREIDIVLLDSMLYFKPKKINKDRKLVEKIMLELKVNGIFCNCMLKGKQRKKLFKDTIYQSRYSWKVLVDGYIQYRAANAQYHMFLAEKINNN